METIEKRYEIILEGKTPLLMHRDNIELEFQEHVKGRIRGTKAGDDRVPPDTWKRYVYADDPNGHVVIPALNMMAMLREAGKKFKVGNSSLKAASQSDIWVEDDFIKLINRGEPTPAKDLSEIEGDFSEQCKAAEELGFRLHVARVVVQKNRHVRVRPCFDEWKLKFTVTCSHEGLNPEQFRAIWRLAGRRVGLGDWRPGNRQPGRYGMFTCEIKEI